MKAFKECFVFFGISFVLVSCGQNSVEKQSRLAVAPSNALYLDASRSVTTSSPAPTSQPAPSSSPTSQPWTCSCDPQVTYGSNTDISGGGCYYYRTNESGVPSRILSSYRCDHTPYPPAPTPTPIPIP